MRTIYIISEDNHGDLAITLSYEDAINFLVKDGWIPKKDEAYFKRMYPEDFNMVMENTGGTILIDEILDSEPNIFRLR